VKQQVLLSTATGKMPRSKWSDYISGLAWYRLGVEPAELSEIAIYHQVLRVSKGCLPHDPPLEEKKISNRGGSSQLS